MRRPRSSLNRSPKWIRARKSPAAFPARALRQLRASPIQGIYELTRGAEIAYVTADGKYAITGDLYDLSANDDLTETRRREARVHLMAAVPESDMVIFGPRDPKYTVTVFTDVDCAYCRKLHSEMAEYNRLGVRVRYLLYRAPDPTARPGPRRSRCGARRTATRR